MRNSIARAILACLRMFLLAVLPAKGKHRKSPTEPVAAAETDTLTLRVVPSPLPPRSPYAAYNANPEPLRGEDVPLIRPYLVAYEAVQYERIRAQRRRAAELATLGIDVGPDVIHGVRLPA
ncbi:hypothetical protein AB0N93_21100 [Streptomyces sp. NPDC091267]|uniref:hypothetical protein n=1 Tax=Streptomyces sp. NPDC091267 TaxID=3155195 RepID=UPI0034491A7E